MKSRHSYALYVTQADGKWTRIGTFRATGTSVREIADYLSTRMPNLDLSQCEVARVWGRGKQFEGSRAPLKAQS